MSYRTATLTILGLLFFGQFPIQAQAVPLTTPPAIQLGFSFQDHGSTDHQPSATDDHGQGVDHGGDQAEAHGDDHGGGHSLTHKMMILMLQLAVIMIAARVCGELFERFLKQPSVLGELAAGMIIGPYALGPYIDIFGSGPLFPLLMGAAVPVSEPLYGLATMASIVLLFMVGLETDFKQFMRYAGPGFAVGVGGVIGSFLTGAYCYVWYSGESFMSPAALFMGTVSTATSVGITARVLSEKKKLDSPEGTTILAGAVIDDVLGILILAVVGGIAATATPGSEQSVDWGAIGIIAAKAFGFWLGATALGIMLSSKIQSFMHWFRSAGSSVSLGLGFAFLLAGVAETFGLAMIIGAYIMGLSLSKERISHELEHALLPIYAGFVPVFFAVMGMLVNFKAMMPAFWFGVVYSLIAVISKVLGSGIPCFFVGFNGIGAMRIGMGMLPRGEVALIVAGVGMSQGFIGQDMFGVVIMMTLVTTVIAPPGLVALFNIKKTGVKDAEGEDADQAPEKMIFIDQLSWSNHGLLIDCLQEQFETRGFSFKVVNPEEQIYRITGELEGSLVSVTFKDHRDRFELKTEPKYHEFIKDMVQEAHRHAKERIENLEVKEKKVSNGEET